jgi:phospholipid-transporting ATPase
VIINGKKCDFQVLNINEFNSDRKRMSIILKDGDMIKLYMKGADTEILKKLSNKSNPIFLEQAKRYVDYFSQYGFRTLLVGMKVLHVKEYEDWSKRFKEASMDLANKAKLCEERMAEIEMGCYLIGATVVEDKLQDQVPECIRDLRLAGIKIWMLTGDKFNTAYNIGLSCNLISNSLHIFKVKGEEGEDVDKLVKEFAKFTKKNDSIDEKQHFGIVIDSMALTVILADISQTKAFLDIAHDAESVICCRVSPLQKAEVVKSMKKYQPKAVTLSIGDGGNDVSMIMEAHIGMEFINQRNWSVWRRRNASCPSW